MEIKLLCLVQCADMKWWTLWS